MIKKFKSPIDECEFLYQIVDGQLSYRIEGTNWQDFIVEDKRAYSKAEYKELMSLLKIVKNEHLITLASDCLNILEDVT